MTNQTTPTIKIELTMEECGIVHDALLALPMRRVEPLVARLRAAAAEAVKAAKPSGGCGGCHPAQHEEPTP